MQEYNKDSVREEKKRQKFNILLFYTLSVIIVCLTAFNFYLFCWIWSNLNGVGTGSVQPIAESSEEILASNQEANNHHKQQAKLNLLSSWNTIKFDGKLSSEHSFQVDQLVALSRKLKIMSKKSVRFSSSSSNNDEEEVVLEIKSKEKRINFPSGFSVKSLTTNNDSNANNHELLVCSREPRTVCLIKAPFVYLTNNEGVDSNEKAIQSSNIETKRIYSAINSLNFLTTNKSFLESSQDKVHLFALDELTLFSRNSSVILDAKTIDISRIKSFSNDRLLGKDSGDKSLRSFRRNGENSSKVYKLCICLPESSNKSKKGKILSKTGHNLQNKELFRGPNRQQQQTSDSNEYNGLNSNNNKMGLVFAVKPNLHCSEFSNYVCNAS